MSHPAPNTSNASKDSYRLMGIPFGFFCSLLHDISRVSPVQHKPNGRNPVIEVLNSWITELQSKYAPLPLDAPGNVLCLLFPEDDSQRVYGLQEFKLTRYLSSILSLDVSLLSAWSANGHSGCLGIELEKAIQSSEPGIFHPSYCALDLSVINELLAELASHSQFSAIKLQQRYPQRTRRPREVLLRQLFGELNAREAAFMTQIILKDLRPLLYPQPVGHWSAALTKHFNPLMHCLTKEQAIYTWDPSGQLLKAYKVTPIISELKVCSNVIPTQQPKVGAPIEIPKSVKGRGCRHSLSLFPRSNQIWIETKYDGERAQIHVDLVGNTCPKITIFSKSKRDSTSDRLGIHKLILSSLNIGGKAKSTQHPVERNVVLDAEMIAFHGNKIDEFWRIKSLTERTAIGRTTHPLTFMSDDACSQESMKTNASESRRLGLVFFDVLIIDSVSLLSTPYSERRSILESLIAVTPGEAILAERARLDLSGNGDTALTHLRHAFSELIADHQEGAILKCHDSWYNDARVPWVKLKKDYIPGYGDNLDLIIIGAGWDKHRARVLGVGPGTYTTMYVGSVVRREADGTQSLIRPHLHAYFVVSYGLNRHQLEELNFLIKNSETIDFTELNSCKLPFDLSMLPTLAPPAVILKVPLLAELSGAGFTKAPKSKHYELRFPRLTKIYRSAERPWEEAVDLDELHHIARKVIGRDPSFKEVDDWCKTLWGHPTSPNIKSSLKRKATAEFWEEQLASLDNHGRSNRILIPNNSVPLHQDKAVPNSRHPQLEECSFTTQQDPECGNKDVGSISSSASSCQNQAYDAASRSSDCQMKEPAIRVNPDFLVNSFFCFLGPWVGRKVMVTVPRERQLHSLESLLIACGWINDAPTFGIERGILVVDQAPSWSYHVHKLLQARPVVSNVGKPIYIVDSVTGQVLELPPTK